MEKETGMEKNGIAERMEDFFFEISSPSGKRMVVSNDRPQEKRVKPVKSA
jgi:hypothetical protein